ncbi:DUF4407 domain-containing protein [Labedaea rhizosphaerae]|uniref:Uncharacterized protein DUF4407 n=1 Tax=Labedaea rhizosphaerae TaxID=598644 RepID=A0A4R6SL03_LABRH|nr:DUF4407 domain-containing protein [Labedaea rhizosphaerae]TDQ04759.1 uncharacterized protein DUF4407 [Labedaea rhizosphaerae]
MGSSRRDDQPDVLDTPGLEIVPAVPDAEENRRANAGRALRWLAGVDEKLLLWAPGDRAKYTALGGIVLGTATIAAFSMAMALSEVLGGFSPLILLPVLIWGVFIANLDRWLVSSSTGGRWGRRASLLVPRFVLAFMFGVVIAEPLVLRVFETAIEQHITNERSDAVRDLESSLTKCNPEPNAGDAAKAAAETARCDQHRLNLDAAFAANQIDLNEKRKAAQTLQTTINQDNKEQARRDTLAANECAGTSGPGTTGKAGRGPECKQREDEARQYRVSHNTAQHETELSTLQAGIVRLEGDLNTTQQTYEQRRTTAIAAKIDELRASQGPIGLLERFRALDDLTSSNGFLNGATWAIRLFFIAIDCMPVLVKFLGGTTEYDRRVERRGQGTGKAYDEAMATTEAFLVSDLRSRRRSSEQQAHVDDVYLSMELDQEISALADELLRQGEPARRTNGVPFQPLHGINGRGG